MNTLVAALDSTTCNDDCAKCSKFSKKVKTKDSIWEVTCPMAKYKKVVEVSKKGCTIASNNEDCTTCRCGIMYHEYCTLLGNISWKLKNTKEVAKKLLILRNVADSKSPRQLHASLKKLIKSKCAPPNTEESKPADEKE